MAQIKCELGDDSCTFPKCVCAMIEGDSNQGLATDDMPPNQATESAETSAPSADLVRAGEDGSSQRSAIGVASPQVARVPHPDDPHPQCGSVTVAESDAARQLITEWMEHQDKSPGFWLTWGAVELVVKHMRLATELWESEQETAMRQAAFGPISGGPRCHPEAHWAVESVGPMHHSAIAVCSICRQPDTPSYVYGTGGAGGVLLGAGEQLPSKPYVAGAGPPACHPFAVAMSKGDGTLVCSHCGIEVGKQT